jgi:DNA-binding transcriptional regulator YiaG
MAKPASASRPLVGVDRHLHAVVYYMVMKAKELKAIRKRLGVSQAKLAKAVGVEQNTIWRWETGAVPISKPVARLVRIIGGEEVPEIRFANPKRGGKK